MDPVAVLLPEIVELVFNQLSGGDLITCSKLSYSWNKAIGSSARCMDKIIVKRGKRSVIVGCGLGVDGVCRTFYNTTDHFNIVISDMTRHLSICRFQGDLGSILQEIPTMTHLRSLNVTDSTFNSVKEFNLLMKFASTSIEKLFMASVSFSKNAPNVESFEFKNLTSLNIIDVKNEVLLNLLEKCTTIESLEFGLKEGVEYSRTESRRFKNFLEQNKGIKELRVDSYSLYIVFTYASGIFPFEVTNFYISDYQIYEYEKFGSNFANFLRSQTKIKTFHLGNCRCTDVFNLVLKLPNLEHLTLDNFPHIRDNLNAFELPSTSPVKKLECEYLDHKQAILLVKAFPKVEYIKMRKIDKVIAKLMKEYSRNLKELDVGLINKDAIQKILPNVQFL
jgi:hypothetical protein